MLNKHIVVITLMATLHTPYYVEAEMARTQSQGPNSYNIE